MVRVLVEKAILFSFKDSISSFKELDLVLLCLINKKKYDIE
ncbi:MAG: hypothetical protein K0T53_03930 [Wolbachia pipientis]|nr:hypothetical protein [Wolbachia pipientis]